MTVRPARVKPVAYSPRKRPGRPRRSSAVRAALIYCADHQAASSGNRQEGNVTMLAEPTTTMSITKLHPFIGAQIHGVDLSRPLDADTVRQIKDAWHEHTVLLFRDQNLSEDDQRRFASHFGQVAKRVPPKPGATGASDSPE